MKRAHRFPLRLVRWISFCGCLFAALSAFNITVRAQVRQYASWSSISNGTDLGNGSVRKTSNGAWDFSAAATQTLLAGDGYIESTAANYNQSISLAGSDGSTRSLIVGSGGWVGIYENGQEVASTCCRIPSETISPHAAGDRYRIEITNSVLRYIRYRSASREVMFTSAGALPAYPISVGLGMSPQNAEWQKTVLAQLTRKVTWSSITNGINLGNGSVRKTSTGVWDFSANAAQTLLRGDGYFESTASYWNHSMNMGGSDGAGRALVVGTGGWAAIYENGQEVANTYPTQNISPHVAGDRYRLEIANSILRYVRYRSGVRAVLYTSTNPLPAYPFSFSLGASFQNSEWQNTVIAQLSQTVTWSYITNGIDLGNGSVRKTSTGVWDFSAGPRQQLVYGSGYFESTASYWNHSINMAGADGAGRALVVGTGGWAAIYENGQEVANTYPTQNISPHVAGDRYRLEISRGKVRYVRYRSGVRAVMFTSANAVPAYALGFSVGASFQNSEWQNTIFSDNVPEHNDASFVSQTVPATMVPGQAYSVTVTMRNTGASTWTPDGDYQLASENLPDNQTWGLNRVNLTTTVLPGSDATFNFTVTAPTTPGSYSFQWRMVQQGVQRFGALTDDVTVQTVNNPPSVNLTAPTNNATFTAGSTVTLTANASDSDGTVSKVEFFQGSVKLGEDTSAPYSFSWTNVAAGSYALTARATDNGGAIATSSSVNITVNVPNQAPVANAGGPYTGTTGTAVQFNGGSSSDADGIISSYQWNFGDGTSAGSGVSPTHTYSTAGTKTVTLTVTDNNGATNSATTTATIANRPPVANAGGAYTGTTTGTAVSLSGSSSSDPDGTIASYSWSFGDSNSGSGATPTHTYATAGTYTVTLTVTDNLGATNSASTTATISNRAPVANAGGAYTGVTGTAVSFNGSSSSDPDGTIAGYSWNFGDSNSGSGATPTHTYATAGTYTVTLTVTDNLGATNSASTTATISNRAPVANAGGSYTGVTGTAVSFSGSSSSDPDGTIASYAWTFGDSNSGSGATPTHTYATAGTYTVTLTVTDNLGATNSASTTATISNRAPVANAGGSYTGVTGTAVSFSGSSSSDPDGTIASYSWNFGDSNSDSGATPTHTYATAGTYTVTLTVTDNLGATNSATTTATISNRAPVANAGGSYTGVTGTAVSFSGSSSSDPDGTIASYAWNFGDSNSGSGATPTHTYATAGTYTVTLTVTDNLGATNSASTTATISNRAPVANAGGPYTGVTGTAVSFSGSSSSDPDGTIASYAWTLGDSNSGSGATPTHTYATAGTYTVTLTVTDNLGATNSASTSATITGTLDARLDPLNRTGGGGEDPLSRNFNWSIPLVGLPGRGGLDLGLSLAYNSLATWTRNGSAISFNDDRGSPSAGFRLGFPVIQGAYYNSQAGKSSFIMITPSGSRTELRQVGTSTTLYQSVDSSYLLLDATTMTLKTTTGTQLSYVWMNGEYECALIKDRNGNYLTINYDTLDRIDTVVDTLSRTITFDYDSNGLSAIKQTWAGQTHYWARFTYASKTIQTNFTNLTVYGQQNNSTFTALTSVKLADDSHYDFDYTSWGQVWKISQYTGETTAHLLNYRSYNLPVDNSTGQTDCPRFTIRHDWAENWNRDTNGAAQEVNTYFDAPVDTALPDNLLQTVTMAKVTAPDTTYQQIYFAGNVSGGAGSAPAWERGLPLLTDTFDSGNTKQRSATTAWTQDDTGVGYQLNPRVTETNITDPAGNHARTSIDYAATTLADGVTINLPENTHEYDGTTQLRRTHITYNLASEYTSLTSLRIIGLVSEQTLYGGPIDGETLLSKVSYQYDESGSIQGTDAPVQHDNTHYAATFWVGRGNVSSVTRHDVVNSSQSTTSTFKYNTAGAVVATLDPLSHGVTISYADSFSDDSNSRNTLAYPTTVTTVTDAGGFSSSMKYNYDFGAATWRRTPLPNVTDNEAGPVQTIEYDSLGRLQKVKSLVNNAYTRYEYPASQNRVDTYATIQDNAGEAHSFKITDGHGRVIASAADHPGSYGGFSGQLTYYDTMGRVIKQSNPTETSATSSSGNPYDWPTAGDDATAGWIYSQQSYDWKGRPLVTTNPSITSNPNDTTTKSASYDGCGCAGGQVVTVTDEVGRQQKVYGDVLGRQWKTEVLNSNSSVYSTTESTFNARDQVTQVRQFQGLDTSGVYQDTTMTFDGYGRLQSKHEPEQKVDSNNSSSTDHTTWTYNNDDTINSVTDARGVTSTFGYNARRLLTSITYPSAQNLPTGVAATSNVSFDYDAAGNRKSMSDQSGSTTYQYNSLSRVTSETHQLSGLSASYTLAYEYNLAGALKTVTDQSAGTSVGYVFDSAGRLTGVTGSGFGSFSQLASNSKYRASGALRHEEYGNGTEVNLNYNGRMQVTHYALDGVKSLGTGQTLPEGADALYYNDGSLKFASNFFSDTFDNGLQDRAFAYDHSGRIATAASGTEARDLRDGTNSNVADGPFKQIYTHDAWDNMVVRTGRFWSQDDYVTASIDSHNRNSGWSYDADGNLLTMNDPSPNGFTPFQSPRHVYDAAANHIGVTQIFSQPAPTTGFNTTTTSRSQTYDGNGQEVKRVDTTQINNYQPTTKTTYYARSSVLGGQVIAQLDGQGVIQSSFVMARGTVLATRTQFASNIYVVWEHPSPLTGDAINTGATGGWMAATHLDPQGVDVGESDPFPNGGDELFAVPEDGGGKIAPIGFGGGRSKCVLDGFETDCGFIRAEAAAQCQDNDCGPRWNPTINNGRGSYGAWEFFHAFSNDYSGWMTSYGYSHWEGGRSFYNSAYDDYNENKSRLDRTPNSSLDFGIGLVGSVPQEPAVGPGMQHWLDVYNGCVRDHFGKSTGVPIPPHDAAAIILTISFLEGTAESLLAVTWASESPNQGFGQYFNSNPNDGSSGNADIGPFQLNYRTYGNDPRLAGLGDVFGGTTTGSEMFRGDPTSNGRMAARILNGYGGGRRAAILFTTGTGPASRSAQGRARARDRGGKYDRWHRKYDDFFGCLKDRR
jgi:YD repeat-containing protein